MTQEETKITLDMTIEEVVRKYPQTVPVFFKHGLACVGCHVARFENIQQGAMAHGIIAEKLLEDLNKVAASSS